MNRAFHPADILLPAEGIDMTRWSVVACDQFTSEPEYWEDVERIVGEAPSTFRLTLPEIYLESDEEEKRLTGIRDAMEVYDSENLLVEYPDAMIYIERTDSTGKVRAGIIGAVDLEEYDYRKGSRSLIRATEGTIVERIPPRIRVRSNAPLELPHIMILIDDEKRSVIEKVGGQTGRMKQLYDFDLMKNGGHLKGWLMDQEIQGQVLGAIDALADRAARLEDNIAVAQDMPESGNPMQPDLLLFAMGDGNHSLATAKEYYEQLKKAHPEEDLSSHPARYALAEIVNLHSPALEFEAIHRIITNVNIDQLVYRMTKELGLVRVHSAESKGQGNVSAEKGNIARDMTPEAAAGDVSAEKETAVHQRKTEQFLMIVIKGQEEKVRITKPSSKLAVGSLQNFLDTYIEDHQRDGIKLDYIHGEDNLKALTWQMDSIGFILPVMGKEELFPTVKADGALPRKTFSMGHAEDKRYYTECRRIR